MVAVSTISSAEVVDKTVIAATNGSIKIDIFISRLSSHHFLRLTPSITCRRKRAKLAVAGQVHADVMRFCLRTHYRAFAFAHT